MTDSAPDAVVSGKPYRIVSLAGVAPGSLDQFIGETDFVIDDGGTSATVCGSGAHHDHAVRFHEKGEAGSGKDTRTWIITDDGHGSFTAAPASVF